MMRRFGKALRNPALLGLMAALMGCTTQSAVDTAGPLHAAAIGTASAPPTGETPANSHEPVDLLHPEADDAMAAANDGPITGSIDRPAVDKPGGTAAKPRPRILASTTPSDFAQLHEPLSDCEREQRQQRHADGPAGRIASYCAVPLDRDVSGLY